MAASFQNYFPLLGIEQDCLLSKTGDVTVGFSVHLPELFTLSEEEYEAFHLAWVKAIRVLPPQSVCCKQDWFLEARYAAHFQGEESFLSRSSERFFRDRPYLEHHSYLYLTQKPSHRKAASSLLSNLVRPHLVPQPRLGEAALQQFLDAVDQFSRILTDSGFVTLNRLREGALGGSKDHMGCIETYCKLHDPQAPLQDLQFRPGLRIGDQRALLFTLADAQHLPPLCGPRINFDKYSTDRTKFSVGFTAPLGQLLSCNHLYSQYILVEEGAMTLKKLEHKRLRLQSLSAYSRQNALSREATSAFLNEAIGEQRLPVKAHFNVLVWSDEEARMKDLRSAVSAAIAQLDAVPKHEVDGAPQLFWAGLPGNGGELPLNETFDTFAEQACCFLNLETAYRSSPSPIGLRLGDRLSGKPLHVDISDEPMQKGLVTNRNKFILGPSGSGKSFFTNHMVRSYYERGTHIVLVDVGHSYKGLCAMVGGYYFTYSERDPIRFNPFYLAEGDRLDTEKKESIKTLLLALWKKEAESFHRSEYVALSNALQGYFSRLENHPEVFPCFNTFYEYLQTDFVAALQADGVQVKDFDVANFLYVLKPYYRGGEFDYLLNATENLDLLSQRLIVFELDTIKDHPILFPVVTIIIMEVFISKMRKLKGVRKMILIEEAWKAIAREGMAEYIKYLFKTVRKFFGEAVVVTQEVEDIISSPVVKQAIINNSDCKILLDQSKYQNKFDQIQELLGLTQKEKALVLSINKANEPGKRYKEVFISLGGVASKVYRTEVSPEEYLAYTTEESEKVRVERYGAQYRSLERGIQALLADESNESHA